MLEIKTLQNDSYNTKLVETSGVTYRYKILLTAFDDRYDSDDRAIAMVGGRAIADANLVAVTLIGKI